MRERFGCLLSDAPFLPGHGREPKLAGGFTTAVDTLAKRLPGIVVGYSLGARLGLGLVGLWLVRGCGATRVGLRPLGLRLLQGHGGPAESGSATV